MTVLRRVLPQLRRRGYQVVTLSELADRASVMARGTPPSAATVLHLRKPAQLVTFGDLYRKRSFAFSLYHRVSLIW